MTRRQPSLTVKASRESQNPIWNRGSIEESSLKEEKEIVDTMGCLGIVRVFAANVFDGKAARQLITNLFSFIHSRWVVERTFPWLVRSSPLSKDYERKPTSSEAQGYFASSRLLLRQTCNNQTPYKMTVGWFPISLCLFRQPLSERIISSHTINIRPRGVLAWLRGMIMRRQI